MKPDYKRLKNIQKQMSDYLKSYSCCNSLEEKLVLHWTIKQSNYE